MLRRLACLGVLAAAAASPPASPAQELPRWVLSAEPALQIGVAQGDPAYQLFDAVSSLVLEDGRIAVLNAGSHEIRFYDSAGRFLSSVGREGAGPGEFMLPVRLYRLGRDSLMVYDQGNARFSIHSLDGAFARTRPAPLEPHFAYDEWLYARSWIDGPPLGRGRGLVRAAVDRLPPPDREAGYRYVKVSRQGHLWTRRPGRPDGPVEWIVYDLGARPIARVTTPAGFVIHDIGRDYLLGAARDESGVERVQLFHMRGAENAPVRLLAAGDGSDGEAPPPTRVIAQTTLREMRSTMQALAKRQEVFHSGSGSYARGAEQLPDWNPPDDVLVRIVRASSRGWTGILIDRRTGATCGVTHGAYAPVGWLPGVLICE